MDEGNFASFGEALVRGFVHLCVNCLPDFFCFVLFCLRRAARLNVDFMFYYKALYCLLFNPVTPYAT